MTADQNRPVYEMLAHDIQRMGITHVFGLMSDDTALFITTLDALGVRFCSARHENDGIAMAEGYASATGRLGVAIIGRGPAMANAIHGAVFAQRTGSPVLLVFGDSPNALPQPNALGPEQKGFNSQGVLTAAGLRTFTASCPLSARATLSKAATAAYQGATALLLPMNVQLAQVDGEASDPGPFVAPAAAPIAPRPAAIDAAAALLAKARRPLILAGLGAHLAGARDALAELADHVGAALATTLKTKDMFRGHPMDCGILGSFSHAGGRRLIDQADCVIAFGAGLNQRTTSFGTSLPAGVPIIHVDCSRGNIGRWFHADVGIVGDARLVADLLREALPARSAAEKPLHDESMRRWLADFEHTSEFEPQHMLRNVDPRMLALELDKLLPAERNVVYDVGNFLQIAPYVSVPGPSHVKFTADFASIGLGFGTALGFACGAPERPTVLFIGDGAFLMTMGELETVVREDLPLVIVLMNDCAYGAELHYLKERSMPVGMSKFPDIDYAPIAEAFGFEAATVRTMDELKALEPLLSQPSGPVFLDCKINGSIAAPFLLETLEQERRKH
jgi:acetolactate synthase-1/2/3 large subunit